MVFPIGDDQVQGGHKPIFSYAFIGINIIFFLIQSMSPDGLVCSLGSIPNEIVNGVDLHTLLTNMFMHGGWMHLIGNMLFLWVFADNIEATIGNFNFILFYLLGGLAASAAHIYFSQGAGLAGCCYPCGGPIECVFNSGTSPTPCPDFTPAVGASGAISAVLGAYLVMFPSSRIKIWAFFIFTFRISAILFLGFWIVQQLMSGIGALNPETAAASNVAWWAHIGGFVFGLVMGLYYRFRFRPMRLETEEEAQQRKRS